MAKGSGLSEAVTTTKLLAVIACLCAMLAGCAETGGNPSAKEPRPGGAGAGTTEPPAGEATTGGTAVGEEFAGAALRPISDSGVSGDVVFKEVGSLGVQVELTLSGLPGSGETYFAQIHEGSCSEVPRGGDQDRREDQPGHEIEHGGLGPFLALVDPGSLAKVGEYADHPEHESPRRQAAWQHRRAPLSRRLVERHGGRDFPAAGSQARATLVGKPQVH
jgi:hypothetical protein